MQGKISALTMVLTRVVH